eukprot:2693475-Prymnesium_polylepis.1
MREAAIVVAVHHSGGEHIVVRLEIGGDAVVHVGEDHGERLSHVGARSVQQGRRDAHVVQGAAEPGDPDAAVDKHKARPDGAPHSRKRLAVMRRAIVILPDKEVVARELAAQRVGLLHSQRGEVSGHQLVRICEAEAHAPFDPRPQLAQLADLDSGSNNLLEGLCAQYLRLFVDCIQTRHCLSLCLQHPLELMDGHLDLLRVLFDAARVGRILFLRVLFTAAVCRARLAARADVRLAEAAPQLATHGLQLMAWPLPHTLTQRLC